jgi:hypothetical protein
MVNTKAAVIKDRFVEVSLETYYLHCCTDHKFKNQLPSACPDSKKPKTCKEHVDYAVRIGCIDCKPGITREEQNHFLARYFILFYNYSHNFALIYWIGSFTRVAERTRGKIDRQICLHVVGPLGWH